MKQPTLHIFTPHSLLLKWDPHISLATEHEMHFFYKVISGTLSEFIVEMVPSYRELAIYLTESAQIKTVAATIETLVKNQQRFESESIGQRTVTIPVCYEEEFGIDLQTVANYHKITPAEVIATHTKPLYRVSFLGFLPGFPYVSGLPETLHTPRRENPRSQIAKGSVGIGGKQTGVYPQDSPGGWQIIGNSPLSFFDVNKSPAALLRIGDHISFTAISKEEHIQITTEVQQETYQLEIKHDD